MMKEISKDQALLGIRQKEFGEDILLSAEKVAIILTQSWCPKWLAMKGFAGEVTDGEVYFLEYDRTDYFDSFRKFKEEVFKNDQIPYIRYYQQGKLTGESNAVSESDFRKRIGITDR